METTQRDIDRQGLILLSYWQLVDYTLDVLEERNDLRNQLINARDALAGSIDAYLHVAKQLQNDGQPPIPDYTQEALDAYVYERRPVGGFLYAVLSNDLVESFARADENNRAAMFSIASYVWNEVPRPAWGSKVAVDNWLAGS